MNSTSRSRTLGSLIAAAILLCSQASHAGQNAANAFDMGQYLGFASYQASVKQYALAKSAVQSAQVAANNLAASNLLGNTSIWSMLPAIDRTKHDVLVRLRQEY